MNARPHTPSRRLGIGAGAVTAAALVLGLGIGQASALPPGGAVTKPNGAKITLSTKVVRQGAVIRVVGTNWKAKGSRISGKPVVTVKLDDRDIIAVFPLRNKRFVGNVRIPKRVKPGRHTLRFLAAEPATSVRSPVFRVVRAPVKKAPVKKAGVRR